MRLIIFFIFLYSFSAYSIELIEQPIEKIENIIFQNSKTTSNNEYYNSFYGEEHINRFYNEFKLDSDKPFYNEIILSVLSSHILQNEDPDKINFFLDSVKKLNNLQDSFVYQKRIFQNVLFDSFLKPEYNEIYLNFLFNSSKFEELCDYYIKLNSTQNDFKNNLVFSSICLIENKNFSQLELLLELYDSDSLEKLNSNYINLFLNQNYDYNTVNYSSLSMLDKYIIYKSDNNFLIHDYRINNVLDIQIALKHNIDISLRSIENAFSKQIINKNELLSIYNAISKDNSDYLLYKKISSEININDKLKIIDKNINKINMNYYNFSRLLSDQFIDIKLLSKNLKYIKSIYLILLTSNDDLRIGFLNLIKDKEFDDDFDYLFFNGLSNFLSQKNETDSIELKELEHLNNPVILFYIDNNFLNIKLNKDLSLNKNNAQSLNNNYNNLSIYNNSNNIIERNLELLLILKSLNLNYINQIDLYYISKSQSNNPVFNKIFLNLISNKYLNN
ncbi:MAG: hypothetical protein CMI90_04830 [Pelagibacteraceae bacterium]|nr:hypothetical protein [Pelagibacteraceae bacterium]